MAKKKQTSSKKNLRSKKHSATDAKKNRHAFVVEVDTGLLVLFGLIAASTFVAFSPLIFNF